MTITPGTQPATAFIIAIDGFATIQDGAAIGSKGSEHFFDTRLALCGDGTAAFEVDAGIHFDGPAQSGFIGCMVWSDIR